MSSSDKEKAVNETTLPSEAVSISAAQPLESFFKKVVIPHQPSIAPTDTSSKLQPREISGTKRRRGSRSKKNLKRPHAAVDENEATIQNLEVHIEPVNSSWLRRIEPYPYTFVSFAKARWIGRTLLEVYVSEFQSYPASYYRQAIEQGRIQVSDMANVDCDYRIQAPDVLRHTVHRHEPSVYVTSPTAPFVKIVGDTPDILAADKPSTIPVHPCGGYHQNSLIPLLERTLNSAEGETEEPREQRLYTIHRLDRLTSGLVILAKRSEVARDWSKAIQERDTCTKMYLARVRGRFPTGCSAIPRLQQKGPLPPVYGEWVQQTTDEGRAASHNHACVYWISRLESSKDTTIVVDSSMSLDDFARNEHSVEEWMEALSSDQTDSTLSSCKLAWMHLACPVRIANHKDGVCESGTFDKLDEVAYQKTVKPAQTSFAVIRYDEATDSTVVLCRPGTGRTHQIRLHLQATGHPIANDPNYGGDMWYANPKGRKECEEAQARLEALDIFSIQPASRVEASDKRVVAESNDNHVPTKSLVTTDVPATQHEVDRMAQLPRRNESTESLSDFIQRTCVWCARCAGQSLAERSRMELLVRSPGIWLHALQYQVTLEDGQTHVFRTGVPDWSIAASPCGLSS